MDTYWDLSQKERAALDQSGVEAFIDAELMTCGVLKPDPPHFEEIPSVLTVPKRIVYRVKFHEKKWSGRDGLPVAFDTREQATAFLALKPMRIESNYYSGTSTEGTSSLDDAEIVPEDLAAQSDLAAIGPQLAKASAIREANDKAQREYDEAVRKQNTALQEMWDDWARCIQLERQHAAVIRTLAEYAKTAGDEFLGSKFLHKVYPAEKIQAACEWVGRPYPDPRIHDDQPMQAQTGSE